MGRSKKAQFPLPDGHKLTSVPQEFDWHVHAMLGPDDFSQTWVYYEYRAEVHRAQAAYFEAQVELEKAKASDRVAKLQKKIQAMKSELEQRSAVAQSLGLSQEDLARATNRLSTEANQRVEEDRAALGV
jgi:hypothetical protein